MRKVSSKFYKNSTIRDDFGFILEFSKNINPKFEIFSNIIFN